MKGAVAAAAPLSFFQIDTDRWHVRAAGLKSKAGRRVSRARGWYRGG